MARATAGVSRSRPSVRRTATGGEDRPKKVGWQVRRSIAEAVKEAVKHGAAESQNAFVEDALLRRLKDLRREKVYSAYGAAARDPAFMEDMRSVTEAFSGTVRDGLEGEA
jgi:phage gp16-like protein